MYKAFRDEQSLFGAAYNPYVQKRFDQLSEELAAAETGRAKVEAVIRVYFAGARAGEGRPGCLVVLGSLIQVSTSG